MNISSNISGNTLLEKKELNPIKPLYMEKLSKDEVKEIKEQIVQNAHAFTFNYSNVQIGISNEKTDFLSDYEDFQSFLKEIGYEGGSIAELSKEQASELVSEDGIFGIKQTSQRIADFVINGANKNENLLRAGREGMLEGFAQAETMWGSQLPDISQKTMQAAIEKVDKYMSGLGFSIIDKSV